MTSEKKQGDKECVFDAVTTGNNQRNEKLIRFLTSELHAIANKI